ncbi:hypothetical protein [Mesorhizobium amorphae]|uniref:hypothetical protein n=1 Tax=Mesorhizobium amorphae TaxID=71433 RepID=UPI0021B47312|nr:hypothetical protein [Mesorhizobium amorphae]
MTDECHIHLGIHGFLEFRNDEHQFPEALDGRHDTVLDVPISLRHIGGQRPQLDLRQPLHDREEGGVGDDHAEHEHRSDGYRSDRGEGEPAQLHFGAANR